MLTTDAVLDLKELDQPYTVIVQHFTQALGVIHQVTLRPDKVKEGLIRLGETPGDELMGWNYPENLTVLVVLGTAQKKTPPGTGGEAWECEPIPSEVVDEKAPSEQPKVLR